MGEIFDTEIIRKHCTSQSYQRGVQYYKQGRVVPLKASMNHVEFIIEGTQDYMVTIDSDYKESRFSCTCPYDWGGYCKHIVASLLYLNDNVRDMMASSRDARGEAGEDHAERQEDVFSETMDQIAADPAAGCRTILDNMYGEARDKKGRVSNRNRIDFDAVKAVADIFENSDRQPAAAEVYKTMAQYISENIRIVDNSRRHYTAGFLYAMHGFMRVIRGKKPDQDAKLRHISYFFERYLRDETELFASAYLEMFRRMCRSDEDMAYGIGIMDPHIDGSADPEYTVLRGRTELLEVKAAMLEDSNDKSLMDFLSGNCTESEDLYVKYIWRAKESDAGGYEGIVRRGAELFPDSSRIRDIMCRTYERDDPRYVDVMLEMFLRTYSWGYYDRIKEASGDWKSDLKRILDGIDGSDNPHMRMDILLREGRNRTVLSMVTKDADTGVLDAYSHELGTLFPKEYYKEYAGRIKRLVGEARSTEDYARIKNHIAAMSGIPSHKQKFARFVDGLRKQDGQIAALLD